MGQKGEGEVLGETTKRRPTKGGEKRVGAKQYRTFLGTTFSSVINNITKFKEAARHVRPSTSAEHFNPLYSEDGAPVWVKKAMRVHGFTSDTNTPLPPPPDLNFLVASRPRFQASPTSSATEQSVQAARETAAASVKLEPLGEEELPYATKEDVLVQWINEECAPRWTREDEVVRRLNEEDEEGTDGADAEGQRHHEVTTPHNPDHDEESGDEMTDPTGPRPTSDEEMDLG